MRATIVSVGSEILRGTLLDTNAQFFAQELNAIGVQVVRATQVQDELDAIRQTLESACELAEIVVVSGGLGPTEDDLTREAIIALTGESPSVNERLVEQIRARFALRGESMPERNAKQAWEIPSADIIPNHHGTAPGWAVSHNDTSIFVLPGPPRENRPMWREFVRSGLIPLVSAQAIVSRTIKTIGIGESAVADRIEHLVALEWPDVATYAKQDGVHVTVTAAHADRASADGAVRSVVDDAVDALHAHVYGFGEDSLAAAVVQPLAAAQTRLAIWEAGTAGAFAGMLLADSHARSVVAEARLWPALPSEIRDVLDFAREATRASGVGTAAALAISMDGASTRVIDGEVRIAFAHAGTISDCSHTVRGVPAEIRRRAALLAAEFVWGEIRSAAGVQLDFGPSSRSSRT